MVTRTATQRGEQARRRILDAALRLFADRGFEKTTMRSIAQEVGLAPSHAYHYFPSKEHLVQAFYARTLEEHVAVARARLEGQADLTRRLRTVLLAKLETMAPHHGFAGRLFASAADPASPLSPFNDESAQIRTQAIDLFREVVEGSDARRPAELVARLPVLLFLLHLGLMLFWLHDRSAGQSRSRLLANAAAEMTGRLVGLASLPLFRSLSRRVVSLLDELEVPA